MSAFSMGHIRGKTCLNKNTKVVEVDGIRYMKYDVLAISFFNIPVFDTRRDFVRISPEEPERDSKNHT